jgi:hypothetical protein
MSSKIKIKVGNVEIEYEGTEDYLEILILNVYSKFVI